ncbi:MAG: tyrosine-type recombinase/integrase [Anaerolineales bacterium]
MEQYIKAFLASLESPNAYSISTRMAYASDLRIFLEFLSEKLGRPPKLSDLQIEHVADFLNFEHQAGRRKSTLMRRRATIRRFVDFLREKGDLPDDTMDLDAELIGQTIHDISTSPACSHLSEAQVKHLWSIVEKHNRPRGKRDQAILSLILETGLSVGTLVALNLSDLDLVNGKIHLSQGDGEDVWMPLRESTQFLEKYINEGRPKLHHEPDEPALFVSQLGKRISRQGVWQILKHWGRLIDPDITLSPRVIRHTAALQMTLSGRPINEIQTLLGHSNPLSTQALLRRLETSV